MISGPRATPGDELMAALESLGRAMGVVDLPCDGISHRLRRENDEWVCNCGRRWEVGEADPHPHGR